VTSTTGTSHELWKDGSKVADGPNGELKYTGLAPGSYVVKAMAAGNQGATCSAMTSAIVISQPAKLECSIEVLSPVLCGYPASGSATVHVTGGTGDYTILWSSGETSETAVLLTAGLATVTITDENNCDTTCEVTMESIPCLTNGYCFYTQGFYGNEGGTKCSENGPVTAYDIMYSVMDIQPGKAYIFGKGSRTFTLTLADITSKNIFNMLPGGSKSAALTGVATYSNTSSWKFVPLSTKKNSYGSIDNNLLSQAMTFFFNLGWNPSAGQLEITGNHLVTVKSADCGGTALPEAKPDTFLIPQDVIQFMAANGYGNTLAGLLSLANDVLGGMGGIAPSSVTGALDAFNRGFDDCRMLVEFYNTGIKSIVMNYSPTSGPNKVNHLVYPNPFVDRLHFEFTSESDSRALLEIYSVQGSKIATLFDDQVRAGEMYKLDYRLPSLTTGMVLYKLNIGGQLFNGKLIRK
jgi:hypothetical protein